MIERCRERPQLLFEYILYSRSYRTAFPLSAFPARAGAPQHLKATAFRPPALCRAPVPFHRTVPRVPSGCSFDEENRHCQLSACREQSRIRWRIFRPVQIFCRLQHAFRPVQTCRRPPDLHRHCLLHRQSYRSVRCAAMSCRADYVCRREHFTEKSDTEQTPTQVSGSQVPQKYR